MASPKKRASEVVEILDLKPHPKGGFCTETFRDFSVTLAKSQLPPQSCDAFINQVFELHDDGRIEMTVVDSDLDAGHRPHYNVPPNVWFRSFPTLDVASFASNGSLLVKSPKRDAELHYSLVGCTCAPGFQFEDFELAKLADVKAVAPEAEPFLNYIVLPS